MTNTNHRQEPAGQVAPKDKRLTRQPIYGTFSIVLLLFMVVTLLPQYWEIVHTPDAVPAALIVHGVVYLGWYVLFCVQSRLSTRNVHLHRTLGYASIGYFALLMVSGVGLLLGVMGEYSFDNPGDAQPRTAFVWGIIHTLVFFAGFYVLGVLNRGNLHRHKRFMVLASLSMVTASVTRIAYLPFVPIDATMMTLLTTYGLLLVPVVIDRLRFGFVHPVLKWGVPVYILSQIAFFAILPGTHLGQRLAFPF